MLQRAQVLLYQNVLYFIWDTVYCVVCNIDFCRLNSALQFYQSKPVFGITFQHNFKSFEMVILFFPFLSLVTSNSVLGVFVHFPSFDVICDCIRYDVHGYNELN